MFQWNLWDNGFSFRKTLLNTSNDSDKKPIITEPQNFVIDWMLAILLSGYCVSTRRWEVFVKCSFCVDLIAAGIWRIVRYLVRSRAGCTASRARFQSGMFTGACPICNKHVSGIPELLTRYSRRWVEDTNKHTHRNLLHLLYRNDLPSIKVNIDLKKKNVSNMPHF